MNRDQRAIFATFNQQQTRKNGKTDSSKPINTDKRVNRHKTNSGNRSSGRGR